MSYAFNVVQFSSPQLRQFNLVTVEMRGYGETRGRIGEAAYTPRESADDVWNVMVCFSVRQSIRGVDHVFQEALALPRLHVFAISIGTSIALELASRHPQRILSMTLCSPLAPKEVLHVPTLMQEILNLFLIRTRLS